MKVGIVAGLTEGQKTGIGVYTQTLINSLNDIDGENEYYAIRRREDCYSRHIIIPNLPGLDRHPYGYYFWQFFKMPAELRRYRDLDIIHDPFGNLACFSLLNVPFKKVITLHDVAPLVHPENFSPLMGKVHRFITPRAMKRSDMIITDSIFSRNEIVLHGTGSTPIRVVYPAVDERYKPIPLVRARSMLASYNLPDKYILYVGAIQKQKNIQALIRAYALIRNDIPHKIVIVGRQYATGDNDLPALAHELGITDSVIFTGYVPDSVLPSFYSAASVFVFPSLYEGFGLPPLEAMACGCPVVCSNRASLPEVVGAAALKCNPDYYNVLAGLIKAALNPATRSVMINRGLNRVKQFTPEKTARKTIEVYREVLKERR